jgi:hypothetical protein
MRHLQACLLLALVWPQVAALAGDAPADGAARAASGTARERPRPQDAIPARVELSIQVEMAGVTVGEGRDVFEQDGREYRVVSEARTAGIARAFKRLEDRRESRGQITPQGIRPASFRQERTGKTPKSASFDWGARKLTLSEGDDREVVDLPTFTLDQTSLPYAYVFSEPPRAGSFQVHVTDGRRLPVYEVAFVGQERIKTRLGMLETLHYRKVQTADDRRGFEFWLSPAHHRLPVRVRIVEKDGSAFDSNVTRIDVSPARTP